MIQTRSSYGQSWPPFTDSNTHFIILLHRYLRCLTKLLLVHKGWRMTRWDIKGDREDKQLYGRRSWAVWRNYTSIPLVFCIYTGKQRMQKFKHPGTKPKWHPNAYLQQIYSGQYRCFNLLSNILWNLTLLLFILKCSHELTPLILLFLCFEMLSWFSTTSNS